MFLKRLTESDPKNSDFESNVEQFKHKQGSEDV